MKTLKEIEIESKNVSSAISSAKEKFKNLKWSEQNDQKIGGKLFDEMQTLKLENEFLKENYKIVALSKYLPVLKDVLKKYDGKQYGKKTGEKINAEFDKKVKKAVSFYIASRYSYSEIFFYFRNENGLPNYSVINSISTFTIAGVKAITDENRINASALESITIPYERYAEQPKELSAEVWNEYRNLQEKQYEFKKQLEKFNDRLPYGMEHLYLPEKNLTLNI